MLSVSEARERYGLSERRIQELLQSGTVKGRKLGKRVWLVDERSLSRYAAKPRKRGPKPRTSH